MPRKITLRVRHGSRGSVSNRLLLVAMVAAFINATLAVATAQPNYRLRIASYQFDPSEGRPELPDHLALPWQLTEPGHVLVQFQRPLNRNDRNRLREGYGLRLQEYFPNLAFLEKLGPEQLAAVARDPLFRASIRFQPAFKISPQIGKHKFVTPQRQAIKGLLLRATLFPDAESKSLVDKLASIEARDIKQFQPRQNQVRVRFLLENADRIPTIAKWEEVRWIEEVGEIISDNSTVAGTVQSGDRHNATVWARGLHGEGQIIGLIDAAPVDINHCCFRENGPNVAGPTHRKVVAIRNASGTLAITFPHATRVAGCLASDDIGSMGTAPRRGGAWNARIVSANYHDIANGHSSLIDELRAARGLGATIHSNSWHQTAGGTDSDDMAADVDHFMWTHEDSLVIGSAGNTGGQQGPPGTAKSALSVAASRPDPHEMSFGSGVPGPTDDGRRKPEVTAPGCGLLTARPGSMCTQIPVGSCASSYATPHVAAACALIRQYFTQGWFPSGTKRPCDSFAPTGALLKATIINATRDMTGVPGYPSNREGWGVVQLDRTLYFAGDSRNLKVIDRRHANGLDTGGSFQTQVDIAGSAEPLKVTLTWSDPSAARGTSPAIVHDLNLVVISPAGNRYLGNHFVGGNSATGGVADSINTCEMVLRNAPQPGLWQIEVNGANVSRGPLQGFALVVTGDF